MTFLRQREDIKPPDFFMNHPNRTNVASPTLLYRSGTQVRMMIWHSFPALARTAPISLSRSGFVYPKVSSKMREAPPSFETVIDMSCFFNDTLDLYSYYSH